MQTCLKDFVQSVEEILCSHSLGPVGEYRRWNGQNPTDPYVRDLGLNPYGCADAANILYTISRFPELPEERRAWVAVLQSLQSAEDGMFHEATHHTIHTTAHCIAALELFDAKPVLPLAGLASLRDSAAMTRFLDALEWRRDPWSQSHCGAGLYASLVLAGEVSPQWKDAYFEWLWNEADPATGMFRKGAIVPARTQFGESLFPHLAGTFHYLFNMESDRRPLRYPAALVDTCLDFYRDQPYPLGRRLSFAEVDWVYCLHRAWRQSGHRRPEVFHALQEFATTYLDYLLSLNPATDDSLNDLHLLFGSLCCLAELQTALPGRITGCRLRLVLDRRPFI